MISLHYVCRQTLLNISVRHSADYEKFSFCYKVSVHGDSAQHVRAKAAWLHWMAKQCFPHVLCSFLYMVVRTRKL